MFTLENLQGFKAIAVGQGNVEHHHVKRLLAHQTDGLLGIFRFRGDFHAFRFGEYLPQAMAQDRMVIDKQNLHHAVSPCSIFPRRQVGAVRD